MEATVAALERCRAQRWDYVGYLDQHAAFEPVRSHPRFQALLQAFAADSIAAANGRARLTQLDLRDLAAAHRRRGELDRALAALERALAQGGPLDAELRAEQRSLRAEVERRARAPVR